MKKKCKSTTHLLLYLTVLRDVDTVNNDNSLEL